ncbi:MAG: RecB family exonuclease [Poseidonia sp.]
MEDVEKRETRPHQLSPSAWNRYETCPRMYWLSRQRLPRKAGMAASLGTAVHASIEDLLNMSLDGRVDDEAGWLPLAAEGFLKDRWEEEKAAFLATPRRPDWKESKWNEAKKQQKGGIILLLDHINARELPHERITVALWKHLQSLAIAVEGELVTSDARLMGRLDLLFAELDEKGAMKGWLVADLKTGNAPTKELKTEVNRQLRMYRDILLANNPDAPPVRTEGWYTKTVSKWAAEGESVLEEAYAAWEATQPTTMPMDAQPGPETCGGFCDWKAWCPHWWTWRQSSGTLHQSDFSDAVVLLHRFDEATGAAVLELCEPLDESGRAIPTGQQITAQFDGRGKEALEDLTASGHQGAIFLGSVMTSRRNWRVGPWCDVLPWSPLPDDVPYERVS